MLFFSAAVSFMVAEQFGEVKNIKEWNTQNTKIQQIINKYWK